MNKTQLIDVLAERFEGNRRQAAHALESVLDTITREVSKGERVAISGFGSFEKRIREARVVRNPRTGQRLQADETAIARFVPGAKLKEVVAGVRSLPQLVIEPALDRVAKATGAGRTSPAKKSAAKKSAAKKSSPAKKSTAKKSSPAKKSSAAKKSTAKKSTAKKSTAKKSTAKKSSAAKKSSPAKKSSAAKKA